MCCSPVVGGCGRLPFEPFFEAAAAEGVETVEEGQGLVEDVCANLLSSC